MFFYKFADLPVADLFQGVQVSPAGEVRLRHDPEDPPADLHMVIRRCQAEREIPVERVGTVHAEALDMESLQ